MDASNRLRLNNRYLLTKDYDTNTPIPIKSASANIINTYNIMIVCMDSLLTHTGIMPTAVSE